MTAIERYLHALDAELRVPRRARRRILAEARDHLEEAAAAGTESRALASFGEARDVAARFHEQLAGSTAARASARTVGVMVAFVIAAALAVGGRLNTFPYGVVVFLVGQVAVVAGAIGAARWLRYRHEGVIPTARLADAYRANGLALACVAVVAAAELADARAHPWPVGYSIGAGLVLAAALVAGSSVLRAAARARVVAPVDPPREDALDDLVAVGRLVVGNLMDRAARATQDRAPRWLDLRRHPWRFCAIFAAVCGLALAVGHGVTDGGGALALDNMGRAVAGGLILASIEAAAVVVAFAAFGRLLGIRR